MSNTTSETKSSTGPIVITRGALESLDSNDVDNALSRHFRGDHGDVCDEERKVVDAVIRSNPWLLSAYCAHDGTQFWIVTEISCSGSTTVILLPEEC